MAIVIYGTDRSRIGGGVRYIVARYDDPSRKAEAEHYLSELRQGSSESYSIDYNYQDDKPEGTVIGTVKSDVGDISGGVVTSTVIEQDGKFVPISETKVQVGNVEISLPSGLSAQDVSNIRKAIESGQIRQPQQVEDVSRALISSKQQRRGQEAQRIAEETSKGRTAGEIIMGFRKLPEEFQTPETLRSIAEISAQKQQHPQITETYERGIPSGFIPSGASIRKSTPLEIARSYTFDLSKRFEEKQQKAQRESKTIKSIGFGLVTLGTSTIFGTIEGVIALFNPRFYTGLYKAVRKPIETGLATGQELKERPISLMGGFIGFQKGFGFTTKMLSRQLTKTKVKILTPEEELKIAEKIDVPEKYLSASAPATKQELSGIEVQKVGLLDYFKYLKERDGIAISRYTPSKYTPGRLKKATDKPFEFMRREQIPKSKSEILIEEIPRTKKVLRARKDDLGRIIIDEVEVPRITQFTKESGGFPTRFAVEGSPTSADISERIAGSTFQTIGKAFGREAIENTKFGSLSQLLSRPKQDLILLEEQIIRKPKPISKTELILPSLRKLQVVGILQKGSKVISTIGALRIEKGKRSLGLLNIEKSKSKIKSVQSTGISQINILGQPSKIITIHTNLQKQTPLTSTSQILGTSQFLGQFQFQTQAQAQLTRTSQLQKLILIPKPLPFIYEFPKSDFIVGKLSKKKEKKNKIKYLGTPSLSVVSLGKVSAGVKLTKAQRKGKALINPLQIRKI